MHAPDFTPPPPRARDTRFAAALAVAALAHVVIGTAWFWDRSYDRGDGGTRLEAISVDLVDGSALEVVRPSVTAGDAMGVAAPAATEGDAVGSAPTIDAVAGPEADTPDKPMTERPTEIALPPPPAIPPPEVKDIIAAPAEDAIIQAEAPSPPPAVATPRAASAGASAGGAISRGDVATSGARPMASGAAPGVVADYGLAVARALSRTRPPGRGTTGDVRVAFTVAQDGSPEAVRIVAARGAERLKIEALDAVRRTRFRPPPRDMTERQRTFEIPYRFR